MGISCFLYSHELNYLKGITKQVFSKVNIKNEEY